MTGKGHSALALSLLLLALVSSVTSTVEDEISRLKDTVRTLAEQLMMQQFYVEEQTRSMGDSGVKQVRAAQHGFRPYHSASHVDTSLVSMHDHANNQRTIGMGEFVAVLNGVEFRTRHNDYRLRMKSTTRREYGAVEDIPFPEVPPEVTQHQSVEDQILELREWFKAWKDQDYSVRDYRPYFKPVLCYMEGSWTHSNPNSIQEPFDSDRHHLDAKSWYDLQNKIRFTSYAGGKDNLENFGYLPATVMKLINNGTEPVLAQWNYDILCHPLKNDLPLVNIHPVDELKSRMAMGGVTMETYLSSRRARFRIDKARPGTASVNWNLMDELMSEVPGHDSYGACINDTVFGQVTLTYDTSTDDPLNVAYYHRVYRVSATGAMGLKIRHRGFSDENLYVAQNTQPNIVSLTVESCSEETGQCGSWTQRWSYAIPLEIIYMTPLSKWNPYNIQYRGDARTKEGRAIYKPGPSGRRNGRSEELAYNGTNSKVFYQTPSAFFEDEYATDPADTTTPTLFVLDNNNVPRRVRASGHRIFLPSIPGVGILRQRYPIMPVHGEGSAVWKELEALKDIVLEPGKYSHMYRDSVSTTRTGSDEDDVISGPTMKEFVMRPAKETYGEHVHHFRISLEDFAKLSRGGTLYDVITDESYGHSHNLTLVKTGNTRIEMSSCDGNKRCFDGHSTKVDPV